MEAKQGKYICIEGIDGIGKTTQCQLLLERCNLIKKTILTSEPSGPRPGPDIKPECSELTMELRKLILGVKYKEFLPDIAREYLFQAARAINLDAVVYPSLSKGEIVIQDRGVLSGLAYGNYERGLSLLPLTVTNFCIKTGRPARNLYDAIIILDGQSKRNLDSNDTIEARGAEYMQQVRENFKTITFFGCPVCVIQIDGLKPEEVHGIIWDYLVRWDIL